MSSADRPQPSSSWLQFEGVCPAPEPAETSLPGRSEGPLDRLQRWSEELNRTLAFLEELPRLLVEERGRLETLHTRVALARRTEGAPLAERMLAGLASAAAACDHLAAGLETWDPSYCEEGARLAARARALLATAEGTMPGSWENPPLVA